MKKQEQELQDKNFINSISLNNSTAVLICCCIFIFRHFNKLIVPSLWAEDGPIFWGQVYEHGIESFLISYNGYLVVGSRLTAFICLLLPEILSPYLFQFASLLWDLLPLFIIFNKRTDHLFPTFKHKFAIGLIYVAMPLPPIVGVNITNFMWLAQFWTVLYLLSETSTRIIVRISEVFILLLLSLTGPSCIFQLLAIAGIAIFTKHRFRIIDILVLSIASGIQLYFILFQPNTEAGKLSINIISLLQNSTLPLGMCISTATLGFKLTTFVVFYAKKHILFIAIPCSCIILFFFFKTIKSQNKFLMFLMLFFVGICMSAFIRYDKDMILQGRFYIASNFFIYSFIICFFKEMKLIVYVGIIAACMAFPSNFVDTASGKNDIKAILKNHYTASKNEIVRIPGYKINVPFTYKKKTEAQRMTSFDYKLLKFNTIFGQYNFDLLKINSVNDTTLKAKVIIKEIDAPCLHLEVVVPKDTSQKQTYLFYFKNNNYGYYFDCINYSGNKEELFFLENLRNIENGKYDVYLIAIDSHGKANREKILTNLDLSDL